MSTSQLALFRLIGKELGYATGSPSSSGTTSTITDTSADSPLDLDDSAALWRNAWIMIEADSAITPLNVGEVRRISAVDLANGVITLSRPFTSATTTTMTYGIYFGMPPK